MEAWIWIPITFLAAFMQAARTAGQKHLTKDFSAVGASYVRFLWGLPFALGYLLFLKTQGGHELPDAGWEFFVFSALTGVSQITATILLVFLFSLRNFAVGNTYARTEALLTAVLGATLFHEAIAGAGWIAIAIGAAGVIMINLARAGIAGETLISRLFQPAAGVGIAAGLGFAASSLFLRRASLSLGLDDWLYSAALTLAMVLVIQTAIMSAYIVVRARDHARHARNVLRVPRLLHALLPPELQHRKVEARVRAHLERLAHARGRAPHPRRAPRLRRHPAAVLLERNKKHTIQIVDGTKVY